MNRAPEPFTNAQQQLDASGWLCPQPVVAARRWLQKADAGERLHVIVTDPHGPLDFAAFCARTPHRLLRCEQRHNRQPAEWHLLIEAG